MLKKQQLRAILSKSKEINNLRISAKIQSKCRNFAYNWLINYISNQKFD